MRVIKQFIAKIRHKRFMQRIDREIHLKIFAHMNGRENHSYPFSSYDEMVKQHLKGFIEASASIHAINRAAARMPDAEGDAFRYIVARDLNERMAMYLEFAKSREYPPEYLASLIHQAA